MMKKMIAVLLAAGMILALAACGKGAASGAQQTETSETAKSEASEAEAEQASDTEEAVKEEEILLGGWNLPESPELTDEVRAAFEKAMEGLVGVDYTPVALLREQVVAGMNYAILCRAKAVTPEAEETWAIVTVYADLQGGAKVLGIEDSEAKTNINELMGGWFAAESPVVTEEAKAAFDKANETITGVAYTPVALVSTQVVAGTNYCILCEAKPSFDPSNGNWYEFVTVYADLQGGAEIIESVEF